MPYHPSSPTHLSGPDDPREPINHLSKTDSYRVPNPSKDEMDLAAAGLNGYGEFIVRGVGCQVIRIPERERVRLAAYLLGDFVAQDETILLKLDTEARKAKAELDKIHSDNPRIVKGALIARG
jgi:hypothetical protein